MIWCGHDRQGSLDVGYHNTYSPSLGSKLSKAGQRNPPPRFRVELIAPHIRKGITEDEKSTAIDAEMRSCGKKRDDDRTQVIPKARAANQVPGGRPYMASCLRDGGTTRPQ